jgi:hypothetical protein
MSGKWFVHEQVLYLRIEQPLEGAGHVGPGMAFAMDVKSIGPNAMVLNLGGTEKDMSWKRVPEDAVPEDSHASRVGNADVVGRSGTNRLMFEPR